MTTYQPCCPWYAVHVWSRQEQAIAATLAMRGFTTFAPSYKIQRVVSGRKRTFDLALFPGYVFCRMDPNHRLAVVTTPGVIAVLGNRNASIPVADEEVDAIQRMVASPLPAEPFGVSRIGERVRLQAGPLEGMEGVLVSQKGQSRLVVSVMLLNRSVAVVIDEDWVPAPEPVFRLSSVPAGTPGNGFPAARPYSPSLDRAPLPVRSTASERLFH